MIKLAALAATLLLCPPSALAWGGLGHETICELAFGDLDDTARQRVIALIRQDPEFTTFRASCNWADGRGSVPSPVWRRDPRSQARAKYAAVHDLLSTNAQVEALDPSYTGATAMAIVPLPLPPGAEARALLHHLLERGDIVDRDIAGLSIVQLAVEE